MLVLILHYAEGLSDRQAAEAVRARIDWKYLLCLELSEQGFDYTILSEFRTRLIENEWENRLFEKLLEQFQVTCNNRSLFPTNPNNTSYSCFGITFTTSPFSRSNTTCFRMIWPYSKSV